MLRFRELGCPCCTCPTAELQVYVDEESGRLFVMCDEVEEGWWDPLRMRSKPDLMPLRDLHACRQATPDDIEAAGWDLADLKPCG